mmetsp:Transcript_5968/g.5194  ORF Transcript_5968/g.5194 Transcript_5968/m.5194 type:complete len:255 (+) Transcript_5968:92-856(+)|eukprot:CAMPEP_0201581446 /NCGR_PEP_ID=MMETSP0190_2-20130828/68471_1 /ASSEMBLY_ACC=CAM_ASM_000263 /TAXON_ID=37353 /ORGANISM="Rosalina sp." /LENGTH=254 /DNA_ID=CAMNT_0048019399 /DNA_START=84 /DNA_END=848 /DNA_ORIENTATION=+
MKISQTEYGSASMIKTDGNDNRKKWNNIEKCVTFIVTTLTIVCVIGYIVSEFNSKPLSSNISLNKNEVTFGDENAKMAHGEHVYDFDLAVMSSHLIITNCADDDDISYDGDYGEYTYAEDIQSIANGVMNNFDEFKQNVIIKSMRNSDDDFESFSNCFKNQIYSGKINCEMSCPTATFRSKQDDTINFCEDSSLDLLNEEIRPNRRSCIIKELASEFSNICSKESISEVVGKNAFKWYKNKYDGTKQLSIADCP